MIKIHLSKILGIKRITQAELSRRTGIRPATISAYYHEFKSFLFIFCTKKDRPEGRPFSFRI